MPDGIPGGSGFREKDPKGLSTDENVQRFEFESGTLPKKEFQMKLVLFLLIIGGWFYLRRKLGKRDKHSFPWVDWFLGIMISLYGLIMLFMLFGVEQKRAGLLSIGIAFLGALVYVGWMRRRIKS
jgi:hypothetical protein